jgi:predicted phage gp36 major capsid-like protein
MTETSTMAADIKTAPEIKAAPETMTAAFDDFMGAFEAFKETNDRRLGEIEQKLTSDVVTRDKMDRINAHHGRAEEGHRPAGAEEGAASARPQRRNQPGDDGAQGGVRKLYPPR